jgi:4'-phosphopantetheinyl transferase
MIELVVARLDERAQAARAMAAWLSEAERHKASRLRFERDRRRFIVARARLRELLAARLGTRPQALELVCGTNGKPQLGPRFAHTGWRFNASHCDEIALYAFSPASDVGIDIEAIRPVAEADAIAEQSFSPLERSTYVALERADRPLGFLRLWTRKEALAKALGEGLALPLERLDAAAPPRGWRLESFSPLPGFIAALAAQPVDDAQATRT